MEEMAIRFALGGIIVSLFAAFGEVLKPKTFAGMFGAAPSVAIATLALAFTNEGASFAAQECRMMILGGVGLLAYSTACAALVRRSTVPVWLVAGVCWTIWLAVSFGLWWCVARV